MSRLISGRQGIEQMAGSPNREMLNQWRRWAVLLSVLLVLTRAASSLNPNEDISQFGHTVWRVQDGFFPGAPQAIAQTKDRYLWIGTKAGWCALIESDLFSGPHATRFEYQVNAIVQDPNGTVWIARSRLSGRDGGPLCRVERQSFHCFGEAEGTHLRGTVMNESEERNELDEPIAYRT